MFDLSCRNVAKRYRFRGDRGAPADFWALRDVSFDVQHGEALGVIGANGAGKSTLLKLLAGITTPTAGEIQIRGRLAAMIEVGSGFHPELTGRENVFLSGAILGMRRREISAKFDRIVEFAGVAPFIDMPVKWYSSGMYVRLGFSIAAHLDPDVLLIDEVLAVGDAPFQEQCLARISDLRRNGTTALFISHDLAAIERLCDRVLLIEGGRIVRAGAPQVVVTEYRQRVLAHGAPPTENVQRNTGVTISAIDLLNDDGHETDDAATGDPLRVRVRYDATAAMGDAVVEVYFYSADGRVLHCQQSTAYGGDAALQLRAGGGSIEFSWPEAPLQCGSYVTAASVRDNASQQIAAWATGPRLSVRSRKMVRGLFSSTWKWRHVA